MHKDSPITGLRLHYSLPKLRAQANPAPPLKFERGYTGHEELPEFDLINMNGRMYDPTLCKMLSADNINNDASSSLGLNRYAYAGNNPLKYTDPSGNAWYHVAIADVLTGGAFSTTALLSTPVAVSLASTTGSFGFALGLTSTNGDRWQGAKHQSSRQVSNGFKITGGLYQTDPNRTFAGQMLQLVSRFTWELPQTGLGFAVSTGRNAIGDVSNVDYYGGATLVNNNRPGLGWGFTLGSYINSKNTTADPYQNDLFRHEYGHTIQSQFMGPAYLNFIARPSVISQYIERRDGRSNHNHADSWFETNANRLSYDYFNEHQSEVFDPSQGGNAWSERDDYHRDYRFDWYWWLILWF